MKSETKPRKRLYSLAAAIGLALGTMGVAAAASTPAQSTNVVAPAGQATQVDQATPAAEAGEVETPGDEAVDGIDHQFEGEEIGNNGDGVADADDANEAPETGEADEVEASEEEADGVDHQFEGEEIGNNGDGVPDADDATEAPEAGNDD